MNKTIRVFAERADQVRRMLVEAGLSRAETYFDCGDTVIRLSDATEDEGYVLDELFSEIAYEYDGERSMQEVLVAELRVRGLQMSTAESCTGGLVAAAIVDVVGSSDVFYEGIVSYHNNAKMDRLGVEEDTLANYGAVSEETALEMAGGLLNDYVSVGVSTTGIAGPGGGSDEKPVGLVYVAVATDIEEEVYEHRFVGERNVVRRFTRNAALYHTIQHIRNYY